MKYLHSFKLLIKKNKLMNLIIMNNNNKNYKNRIK